MFNVVYHLLFLVISIYISLKAIGYAVYEINTQNNKSGGTVIIVFSILVTIFSNFFVWQY